MVTFVVRPATEADGPRVGAIELVNWDDASSPDPKPDAAGPVFVSVPPADVLVATTEDDVVGFVRLKFDVEPAHQHVVEIWGLSVALESKRQGVGTALVREAFDEGRRRGCARMTLGVMAHNELALALYRRCGFVVEGVLRGEFRHRLDGRYLDYVLMAYDLR